MLLFVFEATCVMFEPSFVWGQVGFSGALVYASSFLIRQLHSDRDAMRLILEGRLLLVRWDSFHLHQHVLGENKVGRARPVLTSSAVLTMLTVLVGAGLGWDGHRPLPYPLHADLLPRSRPPHREQSRVAGVGVELQAQQHRHPVGRSG
jgi:hypothetical protein